MRLEKKIKEKKKEEEREERRLGGQITFLHG
jgi:hypothetical protein